MRCSPANAPFRARASSRASAILERDPDPIVTIQPLTPPALEQVVRTCLAKDPDDRFQSAHDLKLQLQWISAGGSQDGGSNVSYSDGYLFYVKQGRLTAQEFDPSSLTFKCKPVSIASNVEFAPARNEGSFSVSRNVLLYRHTSVVNRELEDRHGGCIVRSDDALQLGKAGAVFGRPHRAGETDY